MRNVTAGIVVSMFMSGCMMQPADSGTVASTQLPRAGAAPASDGGAGKAGADMGKVAAGDLGVVKTHYRDAEVDLDPVAGGSVDGEALFLGPNGALTMSLLAGGFSPGMTYTVEIHQNPSCHNGGKDVGPLWTAGAALASLGSPTVDAQGVGTLVKTAAWSVGDQGPADLVDHSLVVLDAKQAVVACGVIWR
jgi:hypothetical protein